MTDTHSATPPPTPVTPVRPLKQQRWLWGGVAGILWFVIFSAGILMDSEKDRKALGWKGESAKSDALILQASKSLTGSGSNTKGSPRNVAEASPTQSLPSATEPPAPAIRESKAADAEARLAILSEMIRDKNEMVLRPGLANFLWAMLLFIPTNVALLTLLAAFVGGCASNEADPKPILARLKIARRREDDDEVLKCEQQLAYMREHPAHSMMRGLVVYLVFTSGLYIASADPFATDGQVAQFSQYIRLAGLLSLLGFVVGYDPSRFKAWVDLIPTPAQKLPAAPASTLKPESVAPTLQSQADEVVQKTEKAKQEVKEAGVAIEEVAQTAATLKEMADNYPPSPPV